MKKLIIALVACNLMASSSVNATGPYSFKDAEALECMALNIYFETRASSLADAMSVSDVVAGAEMVYLLAADEISMGQLSSSFVIYQGHHGDAGAHVADVILPGAAYTEKSATFVNTEGRVQRGTKAVFPPGNAREDWTIIRALSDHLGHCLPYDSVGALRERMIEINDIFSMPNQIIPSRWGTFGADTGVSAKPFLNPIVNFYMTDPISRASETMANCTRDILGTEDKTGTDG